MGTDEEIKENQSFEFTKSSDDERKKFLVHDLFKHSEQLESLHDVLRIHSEKFSQLKEPSTGKLTLADIEDVMADALQHLYECHQVDQMGVASRKRRDIRALKARGMQCSRVDVHNVAAISSSVHSAYRTALLAYES